MAKIFYHIEDNDGRVSAYWAYNILCSISDNVTEDNTAFIGMTPNQTFPINEINKDEFVFIVDLSIPPQSMVELMSITKNVIWVDHHISEIRKYIEFDEDLVYSIPGLRVNGIAASILTAWIAQNPNERIYTNPSASLCIVTEEIADVYREMFETGVPEGTKFVGWHDIFDHSDPETLLFTYGSDLYDPTTPEGREYMYNAIDEGPTYTETKTNIITKGRIILEDMFKKYDIALNSCAFECTLISDNPEYSSLKCLAVNYQHGNSLIFSSVTKPYDIFIRFHMNNEGSFTYTLCTRRDDLDISAIATSFGGGGHRKVGGFKLYKNVLKYICPYKTNAD